MAAAAAGSGREQPPLYHLVQASLWEAAVRGQETYYPPTYAKVRVMDGGSMYCLCIVDAMRGCGIRTRVDQIDSASEESTGD